MGKKSKKADKHSETNESQSETVDVTVNISKDKKSRKRRNDNESSDLVNEKQLLDNEEIKKKEPLNKENKSKIRKKLKESDLHITEISEDRKTSQLTSEKSKQIDQPEETAVEKTSSKKNKVKNKNKMKQNVKSKNKKIIFAEDTGEPVEEENENDNLKEEDLKEEDIDQFCDNITEEDNVQYENWVQLIEAKLKCNKPKSKT